MNQQQTYGFPSAFWWGASTAAHQVEGGNTASDWWEIEHSGTSQGRIKEPSGDAADSYHRFAEDIRLLAESGLQMYRFSVEWARIEPERDQFSRAQLLHYRRMIDVCRQYGVEPMVTLHHFTLPHWFAHDGGWLASDAVERFTRYVEVVSEILLDVTWVCTINEPNMVAMMKGSAGDDMNTAGFPAPDMHIAEALVAAHRAARGVLSALPLARSGWSIATQAFHALPGSEEQTQRWAYPRETFFLECAEGDDWLGVQAYLRTFIGPEGPLPVPEDVEHTLTGWEYFPPALGIGVRNAWNHSKHTPIFVTENGLASADDARRIDYTHDALVGLHEAMDDGVDVLGYLHWSLLDNYEWGSFTPTFGLVGWDKETFMRHPKPSLYWLGSVARSGALTHPRR